MEESLGKAGVSRNAGDEAEMGASGQIQVSGIAGGTATGVDAQQIAAPGHD